MGSVTVYTATKGRTTRALIEAELPNTLLRNGRIVASGTGPYFDGESVFYAAVENNDGRRWALVVLYKRAPQSFWYKDMDESVGPAAGAPKNVMLALEGSTPVNEYAAEWRAECWENLRRTGQAKALRPGAIIKFDRTFNFTDGSSDDTFELVDAKRRLFRVQSTGARVRLHTTWATDSWRRCVSA